MRNKTIRACIMVLPGVGCRVGWSWSMGTQVWGWIYGCKGAVVLADCRREVTRTVCMHDLDGVESKKQNPTELTSCFTSSSGKIGEGSVGTISCKFASSRHPGNK